MGYAFLITHDLTFAWDDDADRVARDGQTYAAGSKEGRLDKMAKLKAGDGEEFALFDADNLCYFIGRVVLDDVCDGFEPLDSFGRNYGCTSIWYRKPGEKWSML